MIKWIKIIGIAIWLSSLHWALNSLVLVILGEGNFFNQFFMPDIQQFWTRLPLVTLSVPMVYIIFKLFELKYEVKMLEGLIPICAWCKKKIKTENGEWQDVDYYMEEHGVTKFTHGICPECYPKVDRSQIGGQSNEKS